MQPNQNKTRRQYRAPITNAEIVTQRNESLNEILQLQNQRDALPKGEKEERAKIQNQIDKLKKKKYYLGNIAHTIRNRNGKTNAMLKKGETSKERFFHFIKNTHIPSINLSIKQCEAVNLNELFSTNQSIAEARGNFEKLCEVLPQLEQYAKHMKEGAFDRIFYDDLGGFSKLANDPEGFLEYIKKKQIEEKGYKKGMLDKYEIEDEKINVDEDLEIVSSITGKAKIIGALNVNQGVSSIVGNGSAFTPYRSHHPSYMQPVSINVNLPLSRGSYPFGNNVSQSLNPMELANVADNVMRDLLNPTAISAGFTVTAPSSGQPDNSIPSRDGGNSILTFQHQR
jgi:hypothetical protein